MPRHKNISHTQHRHRFSASHLAGLPILATNRLIGYAASAIVGIFFPIFLYEFFGLSIQLVLLWYGLVYLLRIPMSIWAAKIFSKTGLRPSMVIGTIGFILFYACAYALDLNLLPHIYLLAGAGFGLTVLTGFYWVPFHVDYAKFSSHDHRGRQYAIFTGAQRFLGVAAPFFAGFVVTNYSYNALFLMAMLILVISMFPILQLPKTKVLYEFTFFQTFKELFHKRFRNTTLAMVAYGAEDTVGVVIWPLFLYVVFEGDHLGIGAFAAVIAIFAILLNYFIGKLSDAGKVQKLLRMGTGLYSIGWIVKAFVDTVVGVFAASAFHTFGSLFLRTPFETIYYERAADSGHYVDEFTVVRETGLSIGRFLMCAILFGLLSFIGIQAAFILAAAVTLGVNVIIKTKTS